MNNTALLKYAESLSENSTVFSLKNLKISLKRALISRIILTICKKCKNIEKYEKNLQKLWHLDVYYGKI